MKIGEIRITLIPNEHEKASRPNVEEVILKRLDNKQWIVVELTSDNDYKERGLYPSEIDLVYQINTQIIQKWNTKE